MPTIYREGPYRFAFYVSDWNEPPHLHVFRDRSNAKVWLDPVRLQWNRGFSDVEINRIVRIIENRQAEFLGDWYDKFGS